MLLLNEQYAFIVNVSWTQSWAALIQGLVMMRDNTDTFVFCSNCTEGRSCHSGSVAESEMSDSDSGLQGQLMLQTKIRGLSHLVCTWSIICRCNSLCKESAYLTRCERNVDAILMRISSILPVCSTVARAAPHASTENRFS